MGIYNISYNIKAFANNYDLSMNFISSSTPILKLHHTRIKKSIFIFIGKIVSILYLIGLIQYFHYYNEYVFNVERDLLYPKLKLIKERKLSETSNIKYFGQLYGYIDDLEIKYTSDIYNMKINTSNEQGYIWQYCIPMLDKAILQMDAFKQKFNSDSEKIEDKNTTDLNEMKRYIDKNFADIKQKWIDYLTNTDIHDITSFCSEKGTSMINTISAYTYIFPIIIILGAITLFFIFKYTSVGSKLRCRGPNKIRIRKNVEEL